MIDAYYQVYHEVLCRYHQWKRETIEEHLFLVAGDAEAAEKSPTYLRQFHPAYAEEIYRYSLSFAYIAAKKKEPGQRKEY